VSSGFLATSGTDGFAQAAQMIQRSSAPALHFLLPDSIAS